MNKIEFVQSYVDRCIDVIESNDPKAAKELQDEIVGVFEPEINGLKVMLDNYSEDAAFLTNYVTDYIGDIKLLQKKLLNHLINMQCTAEKHKYDLELARLKQPVMTQTTNVSVQITIEQTIQQIQELPDESLSNADKQTLIENLYDIEKHKKTGDKVKAWDVAKGVLKFLADKGADAAVAALPLIIQGLQAL